MSVKFDVLFIEECEVCGADIPVTAQALELETICPNCGAVYQLKFEFIREGVE